LFFWIGLKWWSELAPWIVQDGSYAFMAAGAFITAFKNEGTMKVSDEMIEEIFIEVLSMDIRCFYSNKFDDGF